MQDTEFTFGLADRLVARQNADGGWPAASNGVSATEPTAWALRALSGTARSSGASLPPDEAGAGERAAAWLARTQRADGSWPASERVSEPGASTAVAALALAPSAGPAARDAAVRGARWILENPGRKIDWWTRMWLRFNADRSPIHIDTRLRGWSWMHGSWGWVEPTSVALLLLRALRDRLPGRAVEAAIDDGESFLFDRTCPGGGWNYGMGRTHEEDLWPYPDTTAFALLALGPGRPEPAVEEGVAALQRMLREPVSRLATALAIQALEVHGRDTAELRQRLVAEWQDPFPPPTTRALALSLMAAAGDSLAADPRASHTGRRMDG